MCLYILVIPLVHDASSVEQDMLKLEGVAVSEGVRWKTLWLVQSLNALW